VVPFQNCVWQTGPTFLIAAVTKYENFMNGQLRFYYKSKWSQMLTAAIWDGKWSSQQMYDFGFSRRFALVRVWYLSSSEAYTNNYWGLFGKENYLTFDWWKHFLKILRRSEVTINLTRRLKKMEASELTAWKSEVVQTLGWPLPICVQTFPCVNKRVILTN
jgi:hypothetical protein